MSSAFINVALRGLSCTQKELATILNVSPTQITKWKKGEYMSLDIQDTLDDLLGLDGLDPEIVMMSGSIENARKWDSLLRYMISFAIEDTESGYNIYPLIEEPELVISHIFYIFKELSITFPQQYPKELSLENIDLSDESYEEFIVAMEQNKISVLIENILKSYTDVYGFFLAYIHPLDIGIEDVYLSEMITNIEANLLDLATVKLDLSDSFAPNFKKFRYETLSFYKDWLNTTRKICFQRSIALKAELMHLITDSHDELGHEAEAESLGFNDHRLHPDIYMNELLVGMREIREVLPIILDKLGIEFQIDEKKLSN